MKHLLATSLACLFVVLTIFAVNCNTAAQSIGDRYNVIWDSPSIDQTGQMPLGNGDIAAGVYAIEDDALYLLLAKNDAYTYNGDIFKTGRVRIVLSPNPFEVGKPFKQTLDLETGSILIEADGIELRVWADANRPVYHVQIESPEEIAVSAAPELWTRFDDCVYNASREPLDESTQDVLLENADDALLWYYAVGDRSVYPTELEYYDIENMATEFPDPYRFNTFGNQLESPQLTLQDGALTGSGKSFDIRINALTKQTPEISDWIETIESQVDELGDVDQDWQDHCDWWTAFWNKSWIIASDNTLPTEDREQLDSEGYVNSRSVADGGALASQSYNVFRYLMACQSRGRVQSKFNGGLFTQPLRYTSEPRIHSVQQEDGSWHSHEDARDWGRRFTYQNQRLLYWPLLMSGDAEMLQPFFDYYSDLLPVRKAITQSWFGHEGAYYRENIEPTGGERDCGREGKPPRTAPGENTGQGYYHSYYFTCGLETTAMMIEHSKYSGDKTFQETVLVPYAREVLLFFDKHYPRDENDKLRIDPGMVLETWWIAVNSAPDVSGLLHCLDELIAMDAGTPEDQAAWCRFRAEVPDVHLHEIEGRTAIAPAESWAAKHNSENGLLYPVFPFQRFSLGLGTEEIVDWTMRHRTNVNAFNYKCWTQDQIHWAYAGNAAEAQEGLIHRFQHASVQCRFPLYGSARPDSCPDLDHFGSGSTAFQRMLVQETGDKILLLPAWPSDWDVDFKLHLSQQTTLSGQVVDGELVDWNIEPASRKADVVVYEPQVPPVRPVVPENSHPIRIGVDSTGTNSFQGEIGRASAFRGLLTPEEIAELAQTDRSQIIETDSTISCLLSPTPGNTLPSNPDDFIGPVSFEAWIKPSPNEKGRILDKLTAGTGDGFLIDAWPGESLRVIVGSRQESFADVLTPDEWQHIAILMDRTRQNVYLDGEKLQ
jgi:alpha-L-fucosidase 2